MRPTAYSTVMIEASRKYLDSVKDSVPEEYHQQIIDAYYAGMARGLYDETIIEAQCHLDILQGQYEAHQGLADDYKERAELIKKEIEKFRSPMKYLGDRDKYEEDIQSKEGSNP